MSYVNIWVHAVWSTKNRIRYLTKDIRMIVFSHIKINAMENGIHLDFINGFSDHAHALISMGKNQTIADIMQKIKGESSFWINNNNITPLHFNWQDDYYAVSVCPIHIHHARNYIRDQERHHSKISWDEEIDTMIKKFGFKRFKDLD